MSKRRRVAVNRVFVGGEAVCPCVLEIEDGIVVGFSPLIGEQPFTEWIGGTVVLVKDGDVWNIESSTVESLLL